MFEVLVFVYENYWTGDTCPDSEHLERKLHAVGFAADEIEPALQWLHGLRSATRCMRPAPNRHATEVEPRSTPHPVIAQHPLSLRVYTLAEQQHLGAQCLGFLSFLETAQALPAHLREIVLDQSMAAPGDPVSLDDLKTIILMVYWSLGEEPDALVLDELCDDNSTRLAH